MWVCTAATFWVVLCAPSSRIAFTYSTGIADIGNQCDHKLKPVLDTLHIPQPILLFFLFLSVFFCADQKPR